MWGSEATASPRLNVNPALVVYSMSRSYRNLIINCLNSNFNIEEMVEVKRSKVAGEAALSLKL